VDKRIYKENILKVNGGVPLQVRNLISSQLYVDEYEERIELDSIFSWKFEKAETALLFLG